MRARYGQAGHAQAISYGEKVWIGDVSVRFVPAGHVLGSAQIVLEYLGERAVVSGDSKRMHDTNCPQIAPATSDITISEATFDLTFCCKLENRPNTATRVTAIDAQT